MFSEQTAVRLYPSARNNNPHSHRHHLNHLARKLYPRNHHHQGPRHRNHRPHYRRKIRLLRRSRRRLNLTQGRWMVGRRRKMLASCPRLGKRKRSWVCRMERKRKSRRRRRMRRVSVRWICSVGLRGMCMNKYRMVVRRADAGGDALLSDDNSSGQSIFHRLLPDTKYSSF